MASLAPWVPMHVECENDDDFRPEVRIGGSKTRLLTIEELIILAYCRHNTYNNIDKGRLT